MPFPASKKLKILNKVLKEGKTVSEVCREAGIARKTFYQWKKRYQEAPSRIKKQALKLNYASGKHHPKNKRYKFEDRVISIVVSHPSWGSRKISAILCKYRQRISNHALYNLLKDLNLETKEKREEFSSLYQTFARIEKIYQPKPLRFTPETRKRIIEEVVIGKEPVVDVCQKYHVSRKTFYKWLARYQEAKEKEAVLLQAMEDNYVEGFTHPRSISERVQEKILHLVQQYPEYSTHKIAQILADVGNHGVQNVFQRLNLNTYEKRLTYAETYRPTPVPVTGVLDRIKPLIGRIPVISAIPPPAKEKITSVSRPFVFSFFSSIVFSTIFIYWLRMLSQAPTLGARLGLFFASVSLIVGGFFFVYSMKYYLTLAIVLSFSRQAGEEGGGYAVGLNGRIGGNGRNGGNSGPLGWLQRIFGVGNGPSTSSGLNREVVQAGGLQPSLEHIKLKRYPFVSIHLPFYNERKVAERILKACTAMDYPNFEIVVIDDSTDETTKIVEKFAKKHNKAHPYGPKIKVLHRPTRQGFKGGALGYALQHIDAKTEFVVVFDADFIPYPDTLELFIKYFKANNQGNEDYTKSKIAVVGGYQWHVLNKSENWITRGVRAEYAGSYVIERPGREIMGLLKQISGSVYMIRADLLKKFGWGISITEDFQLTLKLYEQGYKVVYTPYVQAPAECASTLKRLIRQRMRWSEGHSHCIKKMFLRLMSSSKLSLSEKLEVLYLSPYYLQAAFFMVGTLSWLLAETVFRARLPFWTSLWGWSLVLTNFFSLPLMNTVGLFLEESEEKDYLGLLSFIALSYIMVPFQAYASVKGFIEKEEGPWFRTPKTGKITDIFTRGRFYRFVAGILPGRRAAPAVVRSSRIHSALNGRAINYANPYLALATANNRFDKFLISKKQARLVGRTFLAILLILSTTLLSLAPAAPYFIRPEQAQARDFGMLVGPDQTLPRADLGRQASNQNDTGQTKIENGGKEVSGEVENLTIKSLWTRISKQIRGLLNKLTHLFSEAKDKLFLAKDKIGNKFQSKEKKKLIIENGQPRKDFPSNQNPELTFDFSQKDIIHRLLGVFKANQPSLSGEVKARLLDSEGKGVGIELEIVKESEGNIKVKVPILTRFKPGAYKLKVELERQDVIYIQEQDFTWGVLAINTNKSIYLPGETAKLALAVLDEKGHMVCDAKLELRIANQESGIESELSTDNESIKVNPECRKHEVTSKPDYEAEYEVGEAGVYEMELKAETRNGSFMIEDAFEVKESVPFDIERIGPTRIYPPEYYPVTLKITANQDFQGEVVELVPVRFNVEGEGFETKPLDNKRMISWQVGWREGETYELSYQFKAPSESPQFYLLGSLKIGDFQETRQWQIAADADETVNYEAVTCTTDGWTNPDNAEGSATLGSTAALSSFTSGNSSYDLASDDTYLQCTGFDSTSLGTFVSAKVWFSFATEGASGKNDEVEVAYDVSGGGYNNLVIFVQNTSEQSNSTNGDYWSYSAPNTDSWVKVGQTTVQFLGDKVGGPDNFDAFVDAVWVEVTYTPPTITVSGNAYADESSTVWDPCDTDVTQNISLVVNGGTAQTAYCDNSSGSYQFTGVDKPSNGDPISVFMNATDKGVAVTEYDGDGNVTLNPLKDRVWVTNESAGSTTNADLGHCDKNVSGCGNVPYDVDVSDNLDVDAGYEIIVEGSKTFAPGAHVTTPKLELKGIYTGSTETLELDESGTAACSDTPANIRPLCIDGGSFAAPTITNFTGTSASTIEGEDYTNLGLGTNADASGVTYTLGGTTSVSDTLTVGNTGSSATDFLAASSYTLTLSGTGTPLNLTTYGDFTANTSTVSYESGSGVTALTSKATTYYSLQINGTGTFTAGAVITADNQLTVTSGTLAMGSNNLIVGSTSVSDSGDVTIDGATSQSASGTFTIKSSSGGTPALSGSGELDAYNLTIGDGSTSISVSNSGNLPLDVANAFTITANASFSAASGTTKFEVGGNWDNNATFTHNSGTVTLDASSGTPTIDSTGASTHTFNDLTLSGSVTYTLGNVLDVNGTLNIASGGLDVSGSSHQVSVAGDWDNDVGTGGFTAQSGTVALDGGADTTQTVTGSTDFYTLSATTGDRTLKFGAGETFGVTYSLTLQGTNCTNLLILRSTTAASVFTLNNSDSGAAADYLDLQDATNSGTGITADDSVNSGNNSGWMIAANLCIGASVDNASATGYSFQRKTFHDTGNTRTWLFYHDGDEIEIRYNSDYVGNTWNVITKLGYDTNDFSVWWKNITGTPDVQYVWLAVASGDDILVKQGTLTASSINWDGTTKTALDGSGDSDTYSYPYLSLASDNRIWVGARYYDGSNYVYKTIRSDAAAGTGWTAMGWDDATQISDDQSNENVYGNVVPLATQDMYATFVVDTALEGCKWDDDSNSGAWLDSDNNSCVGGGAGAAPQYIKKLEQQINIIDQMYGTTSSSYVPTDNSLGIVKFDPAKYNGESIYFETVSGGCVGVGSCTPSWERSRTSFTLPSTAEEYTVRLKQESTIVSCDVGYVKVRAVAQLYDITNLAEETTVTSSYSACEPQAGADPYAYIKAARLIIVQSDATAITDTQTQVEVGNNDTTASVTFELLTDHKIYRWDENRFSGTVNVYFEATLKAASSGYASYAVLSSSSACTAISSSQVYVIGTTWGLQRSGNIASDLTDDTDYWVCIAVSSGDTGYIANAKIIIDQSDASGLTKTQIVHQYNNTTVWDNDSTYIAQDFDNQFKASNFDGTDFTAYFESTLNTTGAAHPYYARLTDGTTAIANTELTGTDTSYTRKRGTNIWNDLPATATDIDVELKNDGGVFYTNLSTSWLIIQAGDQLGPTNIDNASDFGAMLGAGRQVVRTSKGTLYAVINDGGSCEVWKSFDGSSWEQQDTGTVVTCDSEDPVAAAIDNNQDIHVAYLSATIVKYRNFDTATDAWDTGIGEEPVTDMDTPREPVIAVDSSNVPHVVARTLIGSFWSVEYSNRVGGSWDSTPVTVESYSGFSPRSISITINEDNIPEISYINYSDIDLTAAVGNQNDATSFGTPYDVDTLVNYLEDQRGASIAVDQDGNTWIAYIDSDTYPTLAKHNDGDAWTVWTIDISNSDNNVGYEPSVVANGSDIYVFYEEDSTDQKIVYDKYNGSSWLGETVLETPPAAGDYQDAKAKWAFKWNNFGPNRIDYLFSDNTDVYWSYLDLRRLPTNVDDGSDFGVTGGARQVVRTSSGVLYAVVIDGFTPLEVWKSTDEGNSWAQQDSGDSPAASSALAGAAIDSIDKIHIIYSTGLASINYITFTTSDDQFLGSADIIENGDIGDGFGSHAITVDSNNAPHVVYTFNDTSAADSYVRYRNKVGGTWQTLRTVESYLGGVSGFDRVDITISEDNIPETSYVNRTDDDLTAAVGDANNAANFTPHDVDTLVNDVDGQRGSSIAIDSSGNTWIAYVDENGTDDFITLAKHPDTQPNWTLDWTTYTNSNVGYEPSIAIDGTTVYVFYEDDQDDIVYDKYTTSWAGEKILEMHASLQDVKPRWSYINNYDSTGTARVQTNTYYFDNSDSCTAGPTCQDPQGVWTNDPNAFDGSLSNFAHTNTMGMADSNYLRGDGTNAPDGTGTITSVKARIHGMWQNNSSWAYAAIYTDGLVDLLGTPGVVSSTASWGAYTTLSTPPGGWTWSKIQALETKIYAMIITSATVSVYKVEILVQSTNTASQAEIDYLYSDSTDVFYNRLEFAGAAAGSQDAIGTVTAGTARNISALVASSKVHLIYVNGSGNAIYDQYTTDWTFTNVELDGGTANRYLTLSYDSNTSDLYAIWIKDGATDADSDPDDVHYKKGVSPYASANWDVSATEWQNSDTDAYSNVTSNYSGNGYTFAEWSVGDAAPYHIAWNYIIIPEKIWLFLSLGLIIPGLLRRRKKRV